MQLYNENCIEGMKKIKNESIDLVCTDPPYYINYKDWDRTKDFKNSTELWLKEVFRILKPNGTLWSFMSYFNIFDFIPLLNTYGKCHLENWVIVAHAKGRGASKHLKSIREDIFHVTKNKVKFTWNSLETLREVIAPYVKDGRPRGWFVIDLPDENCKIIKNRVRWTGLGNVWNYSYPQHNSICEKQVHPAQKPIMMMERLIRLSSNKGDIVLDPFMGSGSTAIACKMSERNFIGFENNKEYFDIANDRINKFDYTKFIEYNKTLDDIIKKSKDK